MKSLLKNFIKNLLKVLTKLYLKIHNVNYKDSVFRGISYIRNSGNITIGKDCIINSGYRFNPVYNTCKTIFITEKECSMITIGNNVGISNTVIYCVESITIDDNVLIGAGVKIYDTDHHEINSNDRVNKNGNIKVSPILIKKNAFIGAGSMILKGVTIGENSVVGAMSVVTKDIPDNEVWAGNPAVFIRSL